MARYWLRDTATNALTGRIADSAAVTGNTPVGHDWIVETTIRAAYASGDILPGGTWNGTVYTPPAGLTGTALVEARRQALMRRVVEWYMTPALSAVTAGKGTRASSFMRVLEARVRAILVDENLADDTRHQAIVDELAKSPSRWLWKFNADSWAGDTAAGYYREGVTTWVWYSSGDIDTNDIAGNIDGVTNTSITMTQMLDDWLQEVQKVTAK